ncbi:tyrosine-type recombinase/integrase [Paracidovorax citrulli]
MARARKDALLDLTVPIDLTEGAIARLVCPADKDQAFLRDRKAPGLRVRITAAGAKSFVFEGKIAGRTFRRTLGDARTGAIQQARIEANRLRTLLDRGIDPRELEREAERAQAAHREAVAAQGITVADAWMRYLKEGRPRRRLAWKPRYRADLEAMAAPGGAPKKRGQGLTRPGPLYPLLGLPLKSLNNDALMAWFLAEAKTGPHQAARGLMMLRGFFRWCTMRPEYRGLIERDLGKDEALRDVLPPATKRKDALEMAQLPAWWQAVEALPNRVVSVYLRALLLTGARREEMATLRWQDVDVRWRKLTIADKVDTTRVIPLGNELAALLQTLPRVSEFVFASTGKLGRIADARAAHARVLQEAGIARLTLHGLRRSFSLFGEASGAPAGAIAQIMGHKPSATAEGYRPRSIDVLRPFLDRIESHIVTLAGREPVAHETTRLRVVSSN